MTLLLDYGGVLCRWPDPARLAALGRRLRAPADFAERFHAGRREYDRGQSPAAYWTGVVGRPLRPDELADADATDLALWAELDPVATAAVDRAAAAGLRLALLSNMPHPQADAYEVRSWARPFDRLLFSCRLGLVKPDPAIFEKALSELQEEAADVTFLDDRGDNVAAARALGLAAHVCAGGEQLAAHVDRLTNGRA